MTSVTPSCGPQNPHANIIPYVDHINFLRATLHNNNLLTSMYVTLPIRSTTIPFKTTKFPCLNQSIIQLKIAIVQACHTSKDPNNFKDYNDHFNHYNERTMTMNVRTVDNNHVYNKTTINETMRTLNTFITNCSHNQNDKQNPGDLSW